MTVEVHQVIPVLGDRDAVGRHTLRLRDLLRDNGYRSDVFATDIHVGLEADARSAGELADVGEDAILVYQASTHSSLAALLLRSDRTLVVDYHNVTPAELVAPFEPKVSHDLRRARRQIAALAPRAAMGLAVSRYNADELRAMGYATTRVAPFLTPVASQLDPPDLEASRFRRPGTTWLFVGRLAPNKAQHEVVLAFAAYRRLFEPAARLRLVGVEASDAYRRFLEALIGELEEGDHVELVGSVSDEDLDAHYRAADVFVCLSDHEGFGVPLLEAMRHRVPVVAHRAAAVPETLGDAGVLLDGKEPVLVAAAVHEVLADAPLRERIVEEGGRQLSRFGLADAETAHLDAIAEVAGAR